MTDYIMEVLLGAAIGAAFVFGSCDRSVPPPSYTPLRMECENEVYESDEDDYEEAEVQQQPEEVIIESVQGFSAPLNEMDQDYLKFMSILKGNVIEQGKQADALLDRMDAAASKSEYVRQHKALKTLLPNREPDFCEAAGRSSKGWIDEVNKPRVTRDCDNHLSDAPIADDVGHQGEIAVSRELQYSKALHPMQGGVSRFKKDELPVQQEWTGYGSGQGRNPFLARPTFKFIVDDDMESDLTGPGKINGRGPAYRSANAKLPRRSQGLKYDVIPAQTGTTIKSGASSLLQPSFILKPEKPQKEVVGAPRPSIHKPAKLGTVRPRADGPAATEIHGSAFTVYKPPTAAGSAMAAVQMKQAHFREADDTGAAQDLLRTGARSAVKNIWSRGEEGETTRWKQPSVVRKDGLEGTGATSKVAGAIWESDFRQSTNKPAFDGGSAFMHSGNSSVPVYQLPNTEETSAAIRTSGRREDLGGLIANAAQYRAGNFSNMGGAPTATGDVTHLRPSGPNTYNGETGTSKHLVGVGEAPPLVEAHIEQRRAPLPIGSKLMQLAPVSRIKGFVNKEIPSVGFKKTTVMPVQEQPSEADIQNILRLRTL